MLTIGKLAEVTGVKVPTIRYYEQVGLMPPPERSAGNQRLYGQPERQRLAFIRHARDLGFPLQAIRALLALTDRPETSCARADEIARAQLIEVNSRISRLVALREELERMLDHHCAGRVATCRVIEVLGDHGLCLHAHHDADPGVAA